MPKVLVTLAVFQEDKSELNAEASLNIFDVKNKESVVEILFSPRTVY